MTGYTDDDILGMYVNPEIMFTEEGERQARDLGTAMIKNGAAVRQVHDYNDVFCSCGKDSVACFYCVNADGKHRMVCPDITERINGELACHEADHENGRMYAGEES